MMMTGAELISRMNEVGYSRPQGAMWTHIGSDRNKNIKGLLFDEVANDWGISVEEMVCRVMVEEHSPADCVACHPQA